MTDSTGAGAAETALSTPGRRLLYDLVAIFSPSGDEAAAAERLVKFLEANGREAWTDAVGNVHAPADDAVLLTSHVDTVPGELPVDVRDVAGDYPEGPTLWGRGSVDATGPLAAMAVAAVETEVSFLGVVGEETDSRGARHVVEGGRDSPDAVINGEPSGWEAVTLGYRGFLRGTYSAATGARHSARPDENAIQACTNWYHRAEAALTPDGPETPHVDRATITPVAVHGGPSDDGRAVEASMTVHVRVPAGRTVGDVRHVVEGAVEQGDLEWADAVPPHQASPRTRVAGALRAGIREQGGEPRLLRKTGTSDANLFADAWDCPVATYGPGDSSLDHAPDEHLSLPEFDRAVAVLRTASERLAGGGGL